MSIKNKLGTLDLLTLAVGAIIGWGAFVMPGDLFIPKTGAINAVIGLIIGALIIIIIERNYSYLSSINRVAGGAFAYAYKSFGTRHAFFCGWFLVLSYMSVVPLNATALALIAKSIFPSLFSVGYLYSFFEFDIYIGEVILASFILCLFAYFNIKGIIIAAWYQKIMITTLIGIVFFLGSFFMLTPEFNMDVMISNFNVNNIDWSGFLRIAILAPWAYQGFDCITQSIEETDIDSKSASKIAIMSVILSCIIYIIITLITSSVYTQEYLLNNKVEWASGAAVAIYFGKFGFYFLAVALLMAIVGGVNGYYLTASRLLYSMARCESINKRYSKLYGKNNTPRNAIIFILVISLLTPWFGRNVLMWIVDMSALGATVAYAYTSFSAYIQAKKENNKLIILTGFSGGVINLMFILFLFIPISPVSLSGPSYIALVIWFFIGLVIYFFNKNGYGNKDKKELDKIILKEY